MDNPDLLISLKELTQALTRQAEAQQSIADAISDASNQIGRLADAQDRLSTAVMCGKLYLGLSNAVPPDLD